MRERLDMNSASSSHTVGVISEHLLKNGCFSVSLALSVALLAAIIACDTII